MTVVLSSETAVVNQTPTPSASRPQTFSPLVETDLNRADLEQLAIAQTRETAQTIPTRSPWTGIQVFSSTFVTIFLAELGDKTQLTTLLMAAESKSPWLVFAGAGAALVATSFLGVWVGCWLAKRIAPRTLELSAGAVLLLIATTLLWDVWQG